MTGVTVIGSTADDYALNVHFDEAGVDDAWFSADLVDFVDHAPGTTISANGRSLVRRADGGWDERT